MLPSLISVSPVIASHSSFWPLPAIPATPKISPSISSKFTLVRPGVPSGRSTFRLRMTISGTASAFLSGRSISSVTGRPTISSVSFFSSLSFVSTVPMLSPFRRISTRSLIASTSFSLWVMMTMAQPCSFILRRIANSFSVSWGVSTAVGSSRIRMLAPLYKTFRISTVCFSLTDIL